MKRYHWSTFPIFFCILLFVNSGRITRQGEWKLLFNGKDLTGWDTYLGPAMDESGKQSKENTPGLNRDPKKVFSVIPDAGENIIRISGEHWGGISTIREYENFHVQLKFRWGNQTWGSKKGKKKDSGLLYFATGAHGADYGYWMRSQEFQIQEADCGDYWGVAGGVETIPVIKKSDSEYVYHPQGTMTYFSDGTKVGRHCIRSVNAEKPTGEWNTLELYCHGDTSVHIVNGVTVMVLYHSGQNDHGKVTPLTKGKLQIQSEGAEVFYKDIRIRDIKKIPPELLKS